MRSYQISEKSVLAPLRGDVERNAAGPGGRYERIELLGGVCDDLPPDPAYREHEAAKAEEAS